MSGIVFLKCADLEKAKRFYTEIVGMEVWLEQPEISILKHGNLLVGFHQAGSADRELLLTFFYKTKKEVNEMYKKLKGVASFPPKVNEKYNIYHFFAKDPEGRNIEFQQFLHPIKEV